MVKKQLPKLYTRVRFPPPRSSEPPAAVPFPRSKCAANCRRARPQRSLLSRNDCAYMERAEAGCCARSRPRSEPAPQGRRIMGITRRHLAFTGARALGAAGLLPSRGLLAQSSDEAAVSVAVEALTKAMLDADRTRLDDLTSDQLSY